MTRSKTPKPSKSLITRRGALKGLAAVAGGGAALGLAPGFVRYIQVSAAEPIKIGFQAHRTGIGAAYGRWYERTTNAAVKLINDAGGIAGRPIELIVEDDGTDPKRGAEVVEKFASQHKVDVTFGTLFSHVVMGSAPRAGELKMPYYVVSEGHHVASGALEPLHLPARHHRREGAGLFDGAVDRQQSRQEGHHDLPRLRLRLRPPRLFQRRDREAGRQGAGAAADPGDRDLLHQIFPANSERYRSALPRHGRTGRADLRQGDGRVLRLQPAADLRLHRFPGSGRRGEPGPGVPRRHLFLGGLSALCPGQAERCRQGVPRGGRRRQQRRQPGGCQGRRHLLPHVRLLGDALHHQGGDRGQRLPVGDRRRQEEADRGDRSHDRAGRKATSTRRATRPSSARSTSASATSSSPRWPAASSKSPTAPRSPTAPTSRRPTTPRWRCKQRHAPPTKIPSPLAGGGLRRLSERSELPGGRAGCAAGRGAAHRRCTRSTERLFEGAALQHPPSPTFPRKGGRGSSVRGKSPASIP